MYPDGTLLVVGADDRTEGLRDRLRTNRGFDIETVDTADDLLPVLDRATGVVFGGPTLLDAAGLDRIERLRAERPELGIVVFCDSGEVAARALAAGADRVVRHSGDASLDDVAIELGAILDQLREAPDGDRVASSGLFSAALDQLPDMLYIFDLEGNILAWNDRASEVLGYDGDDLARMTPVDFVVNEDRESVMAAITRVIEEGQAQQTARILTTDGERIPYELTGAILEVDAEPAAIAGIGRDITERRRREVALEQQAERLETLNHINAVIRDVNEALVRAETREGIERAVCEHLASAEPYRFAWIGEPDVGGKGIVPRTSAGDGDAYLEDRPKRLRGGVTANTSVRDGEVKVAQRIAEEDDYASWREEALNHGFHSAAAIPLAYRGRTYGVLCVYAPRPEAFEESERAVLRELGETIGYAISAAERRRGLVSDTVVEFDLDLQPPGPLFVDVSEGISGGIHLEGVVEGTDGLAAFVRVRTDDLPTLREVATTDRATVQVVAEYGEECVVRLQPDQQSLAAILADQGGTLLEASASDGQGEATVEVPGTTDVRALLDRIQTVYPGVELRAQRERERPGASAQRFQASLDRALTDRQREVLETAFHAGFFEWPRGATAEEVSDTLGISPPTYHEHLRRVQEKLVTAFLDSGVDTPTS